MEEGILPPLIGFSANIRDFLLEVVTTYAGQCGEAGFLDGPPEVNLINNTVAIGMPFFLR